MSHFMLITTYELCQTTCLTEHHLIEIVELGIVTPKGDNPSSWLFDDQALYLIKKAIRLQQDFDIDWSATALILDLLNKIDRLKTDNQYIKQRLARLESTTIDTL